MLEAKLDPGNKATIAWLDSMKDRLPAYKNALLYHMSLYLTEQVKSYVPAAQENKVYYDSIQQAIIVSQDKRESAYAVILNPKASQAKKLNPKQSLIYIKAKKRLGKADPKAAILERYSPWTLDTLPFMPDKKNADIINRNANENETKRVSKVRKQDSIKWKRELLNVGAVLPKDSDKEDLSKVKSTSDIAYNALRMEFGLDGKKSGSHWRRGISDLTSDGIASILRTKKLDRILNDPTFVNWNTVVPQVKIRVTPSEARSFTVFQKKLGIIQ